MDFECITLPYEKFPRFRNVYLKSSEFQTRYNVFKQKVSGEMLIQSQFVTVHLCKKRDETEFPVSINDLILNKTEKDRVRIGQLLKMRDIRSYLKTQKETMSAASLLVVGCSAYREIDKLGSTNIAAVVIANDDITREQLTEYFRNEKQLQITVTKKATIASEVNTLLERCALAPLKQISEDCYSSLQQECKNSAKLTSTPSDIFLRSEKYRKVESKAGFVNGTSPFQCNGSVLSREIEASKEINGHVYKATQSTHSYILFPQTRSRTQNKHQNRQNVSGHQDMRSTVFFDNKPSCSSGLGTADKTETDPCQAEKRKGGKKTEDLEKNTSPEESQNHSNKACGEDFYEQLLEGILALYGMSNIPEEFRPDVPEQNYNFSKELRNELFGICPTIRRIGYRYRTFYVYATTPKSPIYEAERDSMIASVLQKYGIKRFEIAPCADNFTEFSHVGAKIEARSSPTYSLRTKQTSKVMKGGTLGCFVNMNEGETQCGLLAKHVCEDCCDIYDIAHGKNELLGHILPETNIQQDGSLDISAALMKKNIDVDHTKLKDTRGNRKKGILHEYKDFQTDAICKSGQPVHIYGATSSPGIGEITMPFVDRGVSSTLIQVEDHTHYDGQVESPFAQEGDSGAIVCVEDLNNDVHALGMVMGRSDLKPRDSISTARRAYLTMPLSKGIQQLENDTGNRFTLC